MGLRRIHSWAIALAGLSLGAAVPAQTVNAVTDFQSAPGNGIYSFPSSTPATVMDLMQSSRPRPGATGRAELALPPNMAADAKLPAVVLVHGSGRIYPEQVSFWARRFNERGIAAFVIDVFGPAPMLFVRGDADEGCPLEFDVVDVTMRDRRGGEALSNDRAQALGRELYADKGATLEGNRDAREAAGQAALVFLAKVFKL